MATFTKLFLSGAGNDNDSIFVDNTHWTIHEPTYASGEKDEIWLWINNPTSSAEIVELIWTSSGTFPNGATLQKFEVPPYSTILAMPGIPMASASPSVQGYYNYIVGYTSNSTPLRAFGYVNRITP